MAESNPTSGPLTRMRTKRRYAHEIYPHPDECEARPLAIEVPSLYARAIGINVWGTGWFDADWRNDPWAKEATNGRTNELIESRRLALHADALLQGLAGQEAWEWAETRMDPSGEFIYERAEHYGVPIDQIKPYSCGPEPDHHDHKDPPDARGWRTVNRVTGKESECPECCEPIEESQP